MHFGCIKRAAWSFAWVLNTGNQGTGSPRDLHICSQISAKRRMYVAADQYSKRDADLRNRSATYSLKGCAHTLSLSFSAKHLELLATFYVGETRGEGNSKTICQMCADFFCKFYLLLIHIREQSVISHGLPLCHLLISVPNRTVPSAQTAHHA